MPGLKATGSNVPLCIEVSPQYRELLHSLVRPHCPNESWVDGSFSFYVFDVKPDRPDMLTPPLAVFVVDLDQDKLVLVRLVTPDTGLTEVAVNDMYNIRKEYADGQAG
jgi:hypothetical protein